MDSQHRKIELQSPADLAYLTAQLRTAARKKLDLHLPSTGSDNEPDELRTSVEALVDNFVAQILAGMRSNISINGLDVVPSSAVGSMGDGENIDGHLGDGAAAAAEEEYEPFDDKIRTKLGTTVAKRDALIAKISQYRRTIPASSSLAFEQNFLAEQEAQTQLYEAMLRRAGTGTDAHADADAPSLDTSETLATIAPLKRQEEVERNWERALDGLARLNKGLPETRARLERCGDVVGYLGAGAAAGGGEGKMK